VITIASVAVLALAAGSAVYCVLVVIAVRRYLSQPVPALSDAPPVSILKPLHGLDEDLEQNLRTFFEQDYPAFEILFAVRNADDPVIPLIERLRARYPHVPARLIVTGEPPYANAKVYSLDLMVRTARHDLLVMSDSDIRVDARMLRVLGAEFSDPRIGLATCPYRAVAGRSIWSRLEAVGMNTEFWSGVLVARMLEGMRFAVGPTTVARKGALERVGGFDAVRSYLAEDFELGRLVAASGSSVILSRYVVEHRIGSEPLAANFTHRLRWNRSTRRSRPAGYIGQLFTNPLPLAIALVTVAPHWWPFAATLILLRIWAAKSVAVDVLRGRAGWLLLGWQDLLSFGFWIAGFFGNTIQWRGREYELLSDGRFVLKRPRRAAVRDSASQS
jgi:ceramide glucosyltransferase